MNSGFVYKNIKISLMLNGGKSDFVDNLSKS